MLSPAPGKSRLEPSCWVVHDRLCLSLLSNYGLICLIEVGNQKQPLFCFFSRARISRRYRANRSSRALPVRGLPGIIRNAMLRNHSQSPERVQATRLNSNYLLISTKRCSSSCASPHRSQVSEQPSEGGMCPPVFLSLPVFQTQLVKDFGVVN